MDVPKPYEFIGFGAMDVTKPYEFIWLGARLATITRVGSRAHSRVPGTLGPRVNPGTGYIVPNLWLAK